MAGKGSPTYGAAQDANTCDANLHAREKPSRFRGKIQCPRGTGAALLNHLDQSSASRTDDRNLGQRERAIGHDQSDQEQAINEHGSLVSIRSSSPSTSVRSARPQKTSAPPSRLT